MRRTTTLLTAACLLAFTAVGCSTDDKAKDCTTALTEPTGSDPADTPTVAEAEERVDALDETLASMVKAGYSSVANKAFTALEQKTEAAGEGRPGPCDGLSDDEYAALLTAKAMNGLGWTDEDGRFDKNEMLATLG